MAIQSYRDLVVWREAMTLVKLVYGLTARFPKQEQYGLTSQLRRCSISIPSNIAEGHARKSTLDYLRHISIAAGSLAELETQLLLSHELAFTTELQVGELLALCDTLGKRLRKLSQSLELRAKPVNKSPR
jgi:four helix bundle protein